MAKMALVETRNDDDEGLEIATIAPVARTAAEASPPPAPAAPVAERAPRPGNDAPASAEAPPPVTKRSRRKLVLLLVAAAALSGAAYYGHDWWTTGRFMVSTDDAYVGADAATVAPRIAGYVASVPVATNTAIKAGEPLVVLDDADQKLAITAAENQISAQTASIERIERQIEAGQAGVRQAQAAIVSAQADQTRAVADLERARKLAANQFTSQQSLEQAQANHDKANAAVDAARAGLASAEASVAVLAAQKVEAERALDQDRTALSQRRLDLERTVVRAPFDGVVGNRAVQPGQYVQAGQRLLALVPLEAVYVDANFKETQLARIKPGAKVAVSVDAYDDHPLEGTVESIAPASGSVFSLLPPDNATGNFTKITQRVPVRIAIPAEVAAEGHLRPGMSVVVSVDSRTGG